MTPAQQGPCDRGPQELAQRSGPATSRVVGSRFLAYFWVKWGAELKGAISDWNGFAKQSHSNPPQWIGFAKQSNPIKIDWLCEAKPIHH